MIIAAYAGCGKTTFAKKHSDICVEIASMPYARILPIVKEETTGEFEGEKAAYYHVNNPIYPYNMIADILELEKKYKYIVIPSVQSAIEILQKEYGRNIILCYPEDGLEEEYRERYIKRGNTEGFCQIFADGMQGFLDELKGNQEAFHFVLKSGEYLDDKFGDFEDVCREFPNSILEQEKIDILRQEICKKKQNVWLAIRFFLDEVFYQIKDIDDPEERQFVYNFGKRLYDSMEVPSIFSYDFDIKEEAKKLHYSVRTVDKDDLMKALEKHEKKVERYLKR